MVHNCPPEKMLLAPPQVWQTADLERPSAHSTASRLRFELQQADSSEAGAMEPPAGVVLSSRFLFHDAEDTLDTLRQPTHWGTLFIPFELQPRGAAAPSAAVELSTELLDGADAPSRFEMRARLVPESGAAAEGGDEGWVRCAASQRSGLPAHEHCL